MVTLLPSVVFGLVVLVHGFPSSVLAQDAILPKGDPRLQTVEQESAREKEARDERLKQQGQGSNYRVDGVRQGKTDKPTNSGEAVSPGNTGLSDPSVNPGQAAGMKKFRGHVLKSVKNLHTIQLRNGKQTTIEIDASTTGDKDVQVGDRISGKMTPQGRAIIIHIDKSKKGLKTENDERR